MLKAISLLQPWATLVVMGVKKIETRSWGTAYRGALMIHASKGKAGAEIAKEPVFRQYVPDFSLLPFGAIIGEVQLTDVLQISELAMPPQLIERLSLEERAFGAYGAGRFAWLLEGAVIYKEPIPARGALGLWDAG